MRYLTRMMSHVASDQCLLAARFNLNTDVTRRVPRRRDKIDFVTDSKIIINEIDKPGLQKRLN
jgi:hypothetical protein